MHGGTSIPVSGAETGPGGIPATDAERIRLLAEAVAPRVAALAGELFDPTTRDETEIRRQVTRCLRIGLSACTQARSLSGGERDRLHDFGRMLARTQERPPALVSVHGVVLLGHSEALLACREFGIGDDFRRRLTDGGAPLLRLSEEMTRCIDEGFAEEQFAADPDARLCRPLDALCALITGTHGSWRTRYLDKVVQAGRLGGLFPATVAIARGHLTDDPRPARLRLGDADDVVLARLTEPEPHTLMLCSARSTDRFFTWVRENLTEPTVHTRTVTLTEAPLRYRSTRDILLSSELPSGDERLTDARTLLWRRVLANQRVEHVADYVEEVIGPVLRLPESQRAPLLETLESLGGHDGSVRDSAAGLNVHEKTIRYRVGRIETLTGLNALARDHWPQLHQAVQLFAMFPAILPQ